MSATPATSDTSIAARVRAEIERTIQRNIKGLDYLFSGDPVMGLTPKDIIYKRGTLQLYHYRPLSNEVYRVPVLLVMSLVSKSYILDLAPGQSFIEFLLKQGYDVYLIDWGVPRPEDRVLRLEDYIVDFMPDCIARILADNGEPDLSVIGYCMGGMLAIMYSALYPNLPLKNLICLTTPVNFDGMGLTRQWTDQRYFDVDEERDHEQPGAGRPDRSGGRDIAADERIELEHSREDIGDVSVAKEHDTRAPARAVEECRPITLDLTIRQYVQADPVAVEPHTLIEVADDDNRVMDRAGDQAKLHQSGLERVLLLATTRRVVDADRSRAWDDRSGRPSGASSDHPAFAQSSFSSLAVIRVETALKPIIPMKSIRPPGVPVAAT